MRLFANHKCRTVFVCGTLLVFGTIPTELHAQDAQAQGVSRSDISVFDAFLDAHADIDAQLRASPSLLTNAEFLESHPQLETFLNEHPSIQTQVKDDPSFLMQRQRRFDAHENRRATNPNPDLNRQEMATMDRFLDENPSINKDLRGNPSLVNNAEYLKAHPELQAFLSQHPNVKEEIAENPRFFMQQERRFDAQEPGRPNPNPDLNRQEMVTMDRFLDQNPSINKDLRGNPSLVNNAEYLEAHPQLQAFLSQHPTVRDEIAENPRFFMQQERRFDAQEPARRPGPVNPDVTNQEVVTLDRFLDRHQDIAKSLEKKPELVNERGYLKHHRDLDEFLTEHPAVREELKENPASFMRRENRLEARTMNRDLDRDVPARDGVGDRDRDRDTRDLDSDVTQKEVRDMDHFLDKHKSIDKDLQKKPALVNDRDYLKRHKSLQAFLEKNPHVESEIRQNPSAFMDKERLEARNHRLNNHKPVPKPKTKVEEKEQMHTATPH